MMLEEALQATLTSDSPSLRVYADEAAQDAVAPYVVFTIVGGEDELHLRGDGNLRRRIVQVDVWGGGRTLVSNLMEGVRSKMLAATALQVARIEETGAPRYDTETKLYRSSYDFTVWFAP